MDVSGAVVIRVPPERVAAALLDPRVLARVLPGCKSVTQTGEGSYLARVEYAKGPLPIRTDLAVKMIPLPGGSGYRMEMKAGNIVTGTVRSSTDLTLAQVPRGCRLTYQGQVDATGLIKRFMAGREEAVSNRVEQMFRGLKLHIEQGGQTGGQTARQAAPRREGGAA